MSTPKVAVPFPAQNLKDILDGIEALEAHFPVLDQVGPAEREGLQSIGPGREPYVAEAFADAKGSPDTVPPTVKTDQWTYLEEHHAALDKIESALERLLELVRGIKAQVADGRYKNVRKYYDFLGGNLDVLPGAKGIYDKIARLFAKQGPRPKAASKSASGAT